MSIGLIIIKILYAVLGLIFLKSSLSKVNKPMQFYYAIMSYKIINKENIGYIIIPLLVALESILAILLIFSLFTKLSLILGLSLQIFYLSIIIFNIDKEFEKNCGCFGFTTPKIPTIKHLFLNVVLLLSIVILFGLDNRF
jgi:hypothetical protein